MISRLESRQRLNTRIDSSFTPVSLHVVNSTPSHHNFLLGHHFMKLKTYAKYKNLDPLSHSNVKISHYLPRFSPEWSKRMPYLRSKWSKTIPYLRPVTEAKHTLFQTNMLKRIPCCKAKRINSIPLGRQIPTWLNRSGSGVYVRETGGPSRFLMHI